MARDNIEKAMGALMVNRVIKEPKKSHVLINKDLID